MLLPDVFENNFVDDVFHNMFASPFGRNRDYGFSHAFAGMNTDIREYDDRYEMDLELPGFEKEDIHAELSDGYLQIQAQHKEEKEEKKDGRYIRKERYLGTYQRSFYVGEEVTQEEIKARFENGILKLEIPKKEEAPVVEQNQYIPIEG